MVLVVLMVLGASILGLSFNNSFITRGERDDQSVFYIAEAGVNYALVKINKIAENNAENIDYKSSTEFFNAVYSEIISANIIEDVKKVDFESFQNEKPKIKTLIINKEGSTEELVIESTGKIGKKERTVVQKIHVSYEPTTSLPPGQGGNSDNPSSGNNGTNSSLPTINVPEGTAVFVNGTIKMPNGTINGSVGTNLKGDKSVTLDGGASISGNIFVPSGSENDALKKPDWMNTTIPIGLKDEGVIELPGFPEFPPYNMPSNITITNGNNKKEVIKNGSLYADNWMTDNYTLDMTENLHLTNLKVDQNNTLKINVGNEDRVIVVDNLDVIQGHIQVIGTGKLTFMVSDKINVKGSIGNSSSANQLGIFLQGSTTNKHKEVFFSDETQINGSFYAEDANITMTGGGGIKGNILTGGEKVSISGGVKADPTMILAPNAEVKLSGGGSVNGAIYADNFTANGGATVNYKKPNVESVPIGPGIKDPEPAPPVQTGPPYGTTHLSKTDFKEK